MFSRHPTPYKGIAGFIEYTRARKILNIIKSKKSVNLNILEVGCESGNLLRYLIRKLPENDYFAIDISDVALKEAFIKTAGRCTFFNSDITEGASDLSFPKLDVIICSEVLEHIPDFHKAINTLAQLSNNGTLIIITVPLEKYKNIIRRILKSMGIFHLLFKDIEDSHSEWHINDFSKEDIVRHLSEKFNVVEYSLVWGIHHVLVLKLKLNGISL